ncbi:hypothetical protein ABL78_1850 [Leptomonas seymouri]|uniref:BAG domain-containing protein n=1 Tax=Leptomonas seymouri TaxID=5684 RepID=A0A0N0P829_LEPSE|nr:hypothetical protein ABL78_1850 [Leptomonas seymouri]|eukprot:KPI89037.1 hypothetical protein ABL78_1850 [Leptomonas seymouri]
MWAAWTSSLPWSSSTTTTTKSAGAADYTSSAAATSASLPSVAPPVSHLPQWRLFSTVSRQISRRWSHASPQSVRRAVAAAAAVTALIGAVAVARGACRRSSSCSTQSGGGRGEALCPSTQVGADANTQAEEECMSAVVKGRNDNDSGGADDIQFADPAVSAFNAYVRRIKRQKESVLLSAIAQLESAAAELKASQSSAEETSAESTEEEGKVAQLQAKVYRAAVVADELLTQWICSLDGVPVRQREDLKQRRKELVQSAAVLSQRIAPHLHPIPSVPAQEAQ